MHSSATPNRDGSGRRTFAVGLVDDARFVVRTLVRRPVLVVTATVSLALAIGANAAIFSIVNAVWVRPRPVADPGTLSILLVSTSSSTAGQPTVSTSDRLTVGAAARLAEASGIISIALELRPDGLLGDFRPRVTGASGEPLNAAAVSHSYFQTLGVTVHGPGFGADDDVPGARPTVVVSHAFWRGRLRGEPVVGRDISLGGTRVSVAGIAADSFRGPLIGADVDLWMPLAVLPHFAPVPADAMSLAPVRAYVRVDSTDALPAAEAQASAALNRRVRLRTLAQSAYPIALEARQGRDRNLLVLLWATAAVVLLAGCLTLAGLLLARAEERRHEIASRLALGISRARLMRLLLSEAVVLAVLGCIAGVAASGWALNALSLFTLPSGMSIGSLDPTLDWRVAGFAMAVALLVAVAAGLGPAVHTLRTSPATILSGSAEAGAGSALGARRALLSGYVAMSVTLLIIALLFVRSVHAALTTDWRFAADRTISVLVQPSLMQYATSDMDLDLTRRLHDFERLLDRARVLPGVAAAAKGPLPLDPRAEPQPMALLVGGLPHTVMGRDVAVGARYFAAAGIPLRAGRDFHDADTREGAPPSFIVSSMLAERLWPGQEAVGRRLDVGKPAAGQVVGVAMDTNRAGVRGSPYPVLYRAWRPTRNQGMFDVVVRAEEDPALLVPAIQTLGRELFPNATQLVVRTARDEIARQMASERMGAAVFVSFGLAATGLCLLGVFGLVAYQTALRRREWAIRLALGGRPSSLVRSLVLRQGMMPVAIGCGAGLLAGAGLAVLSRSYLFGIATLDPVSFGAAVALILGAGALRRTGPHAGSGGWTSGRCCEICDEYRRLMGRRDRGGALDGACRRRAAGRQAC